MSEKINDKIYIFYGFFTALLVASICLNVAQLTVQKFNERQIVNLREQVWGCADLLKSDPHYNVYLDRSGVGLYCELQESGDCTGLFKKENKTFVSLNSTVLN